jgi:hypothetical protein
MIDRDEGRRADGFFLGRSAPSKARSAKGLLSTLPIGVPRGPGLQRLIAPAPLTKENSGDKH